MPDDTRRVRQMVDALRQFLGMCPLYYTGAAPTHSWLTDVKDSYMESKQGRVPRRGSST